MLKLIFGPINTAVGSNYLSLLLELPISGRRHRYNTMSCFTRFSALLRRLLLGRRALNIECPSRSQINDLLQHCIKTT